jgi:PAS domain S-box-containing protein
MQEEPAPRSPPTLDFNQILSYDPGTGVLTARGARVVLMGTGILASLRKSMLEALPWADVKGFFLKAGRDQGFQEALAFAHTVEIGDGLDFVKLGSALTAPAGRARMDLEKVDFEILEGRLSVWAAFRGSHEAVDFLRTMGPASEGVCWTLCGYAQGFVEALFDKPVFVVEPECQAMGHASCRLLITTSQAEAAAASPPREAPARPLEPPAGPMSLSYDRILELAAKIAPGEHERLAEFFARKDAELERSLVKYRSLVDASPDVILEVGTDGRVLVANEQARAMFQQSPTNLVGEALPDLFLPEERLEVEKFLNSFRGNALSILPRLHVPQGGGEARTVELIVRSIPSGGPRETALAEIRDVTERARLENEIREREARLRAIFDSAADGIIVWGEDGVITEVNAAAERIVGYKPGALSGMAVEAVIHSTKVTGGLPKKAARTTRLRGLRGANLERRWVGDAELVLQNGEAVPAILSVTPLKGEGSSGSHIALVKDLREVEELRAALATERGKTDAIVDAIYEPMVIFANEGGIDWRNVHAEFVFGKRRVLPGTPCHLFLCDAPGPCDTCPLAAFVDAPNNPGTLHHQRTLKTTDGGVHPFELTLRRVNEEGKPPRTLVVFRDITKEAGREREILDRLRRDDLNLEVSEILLSSRALPELLERFADRVAATLKLSTIAVLLKTGEDWLEPIAVFHGATAVPNIPTRIPAGNTGLKPVVSVGETVLIPDADKSAGAASLLAVLERAGAPSSSSLVIAPLRGRSGTILGALVAGRSEVDSMEDTDIELIENIAGRLGLAIDGVLLAEANQRVLRLQEALIAEVEVMMGPADIARDSRRFVEILAEATGAPSCGLVWAYRDGRRARIIAHYSPHGGHAAQPFEPAQISDCHLLERAALKSGVQIVDVRTLLRSERADPILSQFIGERVESLAIIPVEAPAKISGWIVIGLPNTFRLSSEAEVEVLHTLGQQSRLALAAFAASGRTGELRRMFEDDGPEPEPGRL